ncbi:MAG: aminotransferase class I/II-fold pyridoxal phosphate-dependent enzyme [Candidatus Latescibacteria bacterium]|nr:aminotransferase class I/II-fold pyridoxal phosphate-dependent enzyme [Candidatus Latescibacterota bacterium]
MSVFPNINAQRLANIPKYLFAELDALKSQYQSETGQDVIDFGEGNPALSPDPQIIRSLISNLKDKENHRYPTYAGKLQARIAVAEWYKKRFGVALDPETEVTMLIGSKEGVAHLIWALIDKDDIAYVPSPAYPVYQNQTMLAGGIPRLMPLLEKNNFLPDLSDIKPHKKLKLLCLNYPNNPTSAVAPYSFYRDIVKTSHKHGFYCFNDNVYSELYYHEPVHSILEIPGAKDCCVEFHSLSKTFSICGWRIGFAVGNKNIIQALLKIKQNVDSGPFGAIQDTAIYALKNIDKFIKSTRAEYEKRLLLLSTGLSNLGMCCPMPDATFYLWTKIPDIQYQKDSLNFACQLLTNTGVLVAPGIGFGKYGEGYVRFAAIVSLRQTKQALQRLAHYKK